MQQFMKNKNSKNERVDNWVVSQAILRRSTTDLSFTTLELFYDHSIACRNRAECFDKKYLRGSTLEDETYAES